MSGFRDAVRFAPIPKRLGDKKLDSQARRYARSAGNGFVLRARCACSLLAVYPDGGICDTCGGALLTAAEVVLTEPGW